MGSDEIKMQLHHLQSVRGRRNMIYIKGVIGILLFLCAGIAIAASGDVAGSSDYPLIGRFAGSHIAYYKMVDFDAYQVITGPVLQTGKVEKSISVEGKLTRIAYHGPAGTTPLEVIRNFENRMKQAGFELLYQCAAKACGLNAFRYTTEVLPMPFMGVDSWHYRYLAANKSGPNTNIYATLLTSVDGNKKTKTQLIVVEEQSMADNMVDADKMATAIAETGSIALYGIYFDSNKASIKPESKPALKEIAKLLKNKPELKLIVVGHTDNKGTLDYNMDLSRQRAKAVESALIREYGIAARRLKAWGVGYLSPIASNRTEEGRAKNRRVQLVEQ